MLKATPSRIPLTKFKTKNRKNKFKTLKGRKKKPFLLIQGLRFTDKRQRSKILTDFRQSNRILTDNRQVDPPFRPSQTDQQTWKWEMWKLLQTHVSVSKTLLFVHNNSSRFSFITTFNSRRQVSRDNTTLVLAKIS